MNIDVDVYVNYYLKNFQERFGGLSRANKFFAEKFEQAKANMHDQALEDQLSTIAQRNKNIEDVRELLMTIDNINQGTLLEKSLDAIADALDKSVSKAYNELDINNLISKAYNYNTILENGNADVQRLQEFFKIITQSLDCINGYTQGFVTFLEKIGNELTGTNFVLQNPKPRLLDKNELQEMNQVQTYLQNLAHSFKKNGTVNQSSFNGTLANIFGKSIGESLAKNALSSVVISAIGDMESELRQIPGLTVQEGTFNISGIDRDIANRTFKADIVNTDSFILEVSGAGQDYQISLDSNFTVKQYARTNANIHLVSRTTLGDLIPRDSIAGQNYAYNILAHGDKAGANDVIQQFRQAYSATFFNEWISGSGLTASSGDSINRAQFLMVNGRVYSIMSIIRKVCDNYMQNQSPVKMYLTDIKNAWISNKSNRPNMDDAIDRSNMVIQSINAIKIAAELNANILSSFV